MWIVIFLVALAVVGVLIWINSRDSSCPDQRPRERDTYTPPPYPPPTEQTTDDNSTAAADALEEYASDWARPAPPAQAAPVKEPEKVTPIKHKHPRKGK
jgi:cytoskeletal protein RodZ